MSAQTVRVGRGMARRALDTRYGIGAVAGALLAWEAVARSGYVRADILPSFSDVLRALVDQRHLLLNQTWITFKEAICGFGLSVAVGVSLAVAMVSVRPIERSLRPLLVAGQVVPKIALAPLFLALFGFGIEPKIILAFLLGFFPVVIDTVLGMKSLQPEKLYLARACGASPISIFLKLRFPNALPLMFTGFKIAATLSITGAIVGEFVSPASGLGETVIVAGTELKTALLFAGILCIGALGFAMFLSMGWLERAVLGWHISQRSAERRRS